jgi:hypothetical protein
MCRGERGTFAVVRGRRPRFALDCTLDEQRWFARAAPMRRVALVGGLDDCTAYPDGCRWVHGAGGGGSQDGSGRVATFLVPWHFILRQSWQEIP